MGRGLAGRRLRWLVTFTLLLLASTAVPVLAESEAPSAVAEEGVPAPDPLEIQAGLEESEQDEEARERWLKSEEAKQAREDSRLAYADQSAAEAKDLLREHFGEQLAFLNREDPARVISDAIVRDLYPGEGAAIELGGQELLVEGPIPTHAEDEDGELRKIDLDLEATAEGFEARNPLVGVSISDTAAGPVQVGEGGKEVAISAVGGVDTAAQRFGDKDIFYPEVHEDTDRLVSVTGTGAEFFDLLRSERSPETLRYSLDLPEGATLRTDGEGAEVASEGETLMRVRPPVAIDAQGADVPVTMEVEGETLVLNVPHRGMDVARPVLLDPVFEWEIQEDWYSQNWYNGYHISNLYHWDFTTNSSWIYGKTYTINYNFGGSGRGLHVSSRPGDFGPGKWGHWYYDLPNLNAYVEAISVLPFKYRNWDCQKYYHQQPDDYVGLWDAVNQKYVRLIYNDSYYKGYSNVGFPNEWPGWGHLAMIGLSMGSGPDIPCWRDFYAGGVLLYLSDWADPEVNGFSGIPSGWIGPDTPVTVTANTYDAGLGVREVAFNPQDTATLVDHVGCSGLAGDRCPTGFAAQRTFTGKSLDEGKKWVRATAIDALGRGSDAEVEYTKVDRSEPKLTLDGQLAKATNEVGSSEKPAGEGDELVLPVYRLQIDATDGSNSEAKLMRSGVKDIRVYLDGVEQEVPWEPNPSPCDSCPMNVTYELKLHDVSPGKHTLEVDVEDHVGLKRERDIEFEYFPATGMKDEYVMHYFPLPDGEGEEGEEEHPRRPELAVNVMNGNLVYREQDIDVEGPAVDLEVERYYNSMLPEEENTEWGDGWTLAQTPDLEPQQAEGPPSEAKLRDQSGALDQEVELPTTPGAESFDPELQATLTKEEGGYELTDETGESATTTAFDESGRTEELRTGEGTPEEATVEYAYEGGELAEIAVEDPGSAGSPTEEPQEEGSEEEGEEAGELATFVAAFGSAGSGNGQLSGPRDVAVGPEGNVWVADLYNNRIQQFTAGGQFIRTVGSYGSANGQFYYPSGIDVDAAGNVWVADAGNDRVQKFSPEGAYLGKFGTSGSGNGQLSWPAGLAIDPQGDIWVAESGNSRVQEFSAEGTYLGGFGEEGEGEGQFFGPEAIDVDPSGNVWVADTYGNRLQKLSPEGQYLLEADAEAGPFEYPTGLAADTEGNVWVTDTYGSRIQVFDAQGAHLGQVGSEGSGEGQLYYPMGIDAGPGGEVWIADTEGDRIQRWAAGASIAPKTGVYLGGTGSEGSEEGQFSFPIGVAVDPEGDVLVADTSNNRIQRFDSEGQFVEAFGTPGSGNGQLSTPYGVAVDAQGNVWVTDSGNKRVQKFGPEGQYLAQFGEEGSGDGQFASPFGITVDEEGDVWVTDWFNQRVQEFDPEGQFIQKFGEAGTGNGQFSFPFDIAVEDGGRVWVSDAMNSRLQQFTQQGQFIRSVGTEGQGEGQLAFPAGIEIGPEGGIWVTDSANNRVQGFTATGTYIGQFGQAGSAEGQLSQPYGLAGDSTGSFWLTDSGNNRIQWWHPIEEPGPEAPLPEDDPVVEVETPDGLVSSVSGEEAGTHAYQHEGELLTAHSGPQGETSYDYDEEGRLTKVTLPNGTWGEVEYDADDGRVKSVTVDPAGEELAATTQFYFTDAPERRTKVVPSNAPYTVYEIGEDGSVLKWWNTEKPPTFLLAGTLADVADPSQPISVGDHTLEVQADSAEGIASIEVIAEGDTLVDEAYCEAESEETEIEECENLINEWVTHTSLHAPGRLDLEVIVTDRIGNSASERFWVTVPKPPPPPPPGAQVPPKFHDILEFREEYGLEVVFPVANELELHDRIFNLIGAWYNPHSEEGKVARASMAKWGVPLRQVDVEEMEYREWFYRVNAERIDQWVEATSPSSYGGYYLDHAAGGVMHIGFTSDQADWLNDLKASLPLVAGGRLQVYATTPTASYLSVQATSQSVSAAIESNPTLAELVVNVKEDEAGKAVYVGTQDVAQVEDILDQMLGPNAPVVVAYEASGGSPLSGRFRNEGRMRAGDFIVSRRFQEEKHIGNKDCTAGFGAKNKAGTEVRGKPLWRLFVLTAGHCTGSNVYAKQVFRSTDANSLNEDSWTEVGQVARDAFTGVAKTVRTDAEAIRVRAASIVPQVIYGWSGNPIRTGRAGKVRKNYTVCFSGAKTQVPQCGQVVARSTHWNGASDNVVRGGYWVEFSRPATGGDSGAPVWTPAPGSPSIGLVTAGRPEGSLTETLVEPLLHPPNMAANAVPGILNNPFLRPLSLKRGG